MECQEASKCQEQPHPLNLLLVPNQHKLVLQQELLLVASKLNQTHSEPLEAWEAWAAWVEA